MDGFIKPPLGKRLSAFVIDLILICFLQNMVVGIVILLLLDFDFTDLEAKSGVFLQGVLIGTPITFLIFCLKIFIKV